jgi:hypothetical protein
MIALQARNPQLPDPSRQTAQYVNMMNMARQQEAAQRQTQQAQQAMTIAAAKEGRDVETQASAQKKAEIEYVGLVADQFSRDVGKLKEGDIAGAEALRANVVKEIPAWGDYIRPASEWTQGYRVQLMLKGKEIADKTIPDIVASKEYAAKGAVDAQGNPIPEGTVVDTRVGGFSGAAGSTPLRATGAATPAPRATPTAPQSNPFAADAPPANTAAENVNSLGLTIASARETGVMAQRDVDKLLSAAAPGSAPKLMAWLSQNNIQVVPDAPGVTDNQMRGAAADLPSKMRTTPMAYDGQTPESQFAVYRGEPMQSQTAGLRGAPPMEQTLAQYIPVQRRDPNVGAYPGSATVPLPRVEAESRARAVGSRETPAEIKIRKAAELQAAEEFEETNKGPRLARERQKVFEGERAKKDAAFLDTYNDATTKGRTTLNVISQMIGDAKVEKGSLVIPKGGRRPHPGFEGVVGMGVPGVRFIPGTQAASFDALFRQAEGGAFLQAYESLRGTGQITEIEGTKATSALTRMERSQTEVEFVKAAREFADVIRGAVARADKRYTTLTGEAPPAAPTQRKTSTKSTLSTATRKKYGL